MKYSVVGFPRIGAKRELKFATEKYFKEEISADELYKAAADLREEQWKRQEASREALIPANDFSFYDGMLDTSWMLGAVPKRYRDLNLSDIDTYFAMAHGYQGSAGDVKAFTMKKWFNTNYHYMVPELDDDMTLGFKSKVCLGDVKEALSLGITPKLTVIGPFTFLKLARCTGSKSKDDFAEELAAAYIDILKAASDLGLTWVQIDEPSLVTDLDGSQIEKFCRLYSKILENKGNIKVLLQTYFGDVRDCFEEITAMKFDGIGLDFIEGKQTFNLIKELGFPNDKTLFAGLINGKNIWRTDYRNVLEKLAELRAQGTDVVLSTSCSLLHVPYTVENEPQLPSDIIKHFSFAYEKLGEMREICELAESGDYEAAPAFIKNQELFKEGKEARTDAEVQKALAALNDSDFKREMPRKERQKLQHELLNLPLLPTTTIGSFPQTAEVKRNRAKFRRGEITEAEYRENAKAFIADCIKLQEKIGLDVLVHGEFERNDMVEFFGENLDGFVFTANAWVQSYGTRGVKPPIVFGDVSRKSPITVDYIAYANTLTKKDVKGMLTGPVTILNWSFPREDISIKEEMFQIGLAIRQEVLDLEAAGVRIIQIDEAALREKLPLRKADWQSDYLDFAIPAFRLCHAKVKPETQIHTHMCYSEFEDIIPAIDAMDADVITFEASRSKLTILDALKENNFETEVGPGVYDIHSPRIPSEEEIAAAIAIMLEKIPADELWVNPDCGLKTRENKETVPSLKNLVGAAKIMRAGL